MKKPTFLFAVLFLMAITAESVKSQSSATARANAAATIVTPITIAKTVDLNFGAIAPSTTAGMVTVGYDNSISGSEGVALIPQLGTHSSASFTVNGAANASFYVTLPSNAMLTLVDGTETMTVSSFFHSATGMLNETGVEVFNVEATLAVGANQLPGLYEGTFEVTVTYE